MLSEPYRRADVRDTLETLSGLLAAVAFTFDVLEAAMAAQEADTLGRDLAAARLACIRAGVVLAGEATERAPGLVVSMR